MTFDPNCPKCGAHDYGLFAAALQDCPHCLRAELAAARALLREAQNYVIDIQDFVVEGSPYAEAAESCADRIDACLADEVKHE